jgi:hypothetical protein
VLDAGPVAGAWPVDEGKFAWAAEVGKDDAFDPHPKATIKHRVATNKAALDTGSPWGGPKEN